MCRTSLCLRKSAFVCCGDSDRTHVIVLDDSSLYKIEPNSGKVLITVACAGGRFAGLYGSRLKRGCLCRFDEERSTVRAGKGTSFQRKSLKRTSRQTRDFDASQRKSGVLCFAEGNAIRWHISDARQGSRPRAPLNQIGQSWLPWPLILSTRLSNHWPTRFISTIPQQANCRLMYMKPTH